MKQYEEIVVASMTGDTNKILSLLSLTERSSLGVRVQSALGMSSKIGSLGPG